MRDNEEQVYPVTKFIGFALPTASSTMLLVTCYLDGWRSGEYAKAFLAVVFGSLVLGCTLAAFTPRSWRAFGVGLAIGGGAGMAVIIVVVVWFIWVLSNSGL